MKRILSMRATRVMSCLSGALLFASLSIAQPTETDPAPEAVPAPQLDDFTERSIVSERRTLDYQPIREADILWEKRLWRIIDVREKMNLPFVYPEAPLFTLLESAARSGDLPVYQDERFTTPMTPEEIGGLINKRDTVYRMNFDTGIDEAVPVENMVDWENVKRYRVKEAWFFDKNTSTLRFRILGIAPMIDETDQDGNFKFERPLFWVHYPSARPLLAKNKVFITGDNVSTTLTWEDLFERRRFASVIYKDSNLYDRKIQDYLSGVDMLQEAGKISDELFNREHDLWSW